MKPSAYLDAVKAQLNIATDYELAKRLEVPRGHVAEYRNGKRGVPLAAAFKLAIALQLDPAQVVADLEEQREKNTSRRDFWRGFLSRASTVIAVVLCTLVWSFSATCAGGANALYL
jgi:hypothetical protein